ncbi:tRNA-modifying protein YgfZ [Thalassotalea ponticola]|uniref:tRNA-modifying protein YgfZ n=1 Tax=Thalassotalea ponticola TaxID=1523392 RepID=UPI0025B39D8C|nr:tRNA-modifying protein YgfZ [Thalassotalea ponticola]MDN3652108.1 tRNA-modifying protein YgfZ [Thalassotalea ponticola]
MNIQASHPALDQLPANFAIVADNISAIRISGPETVAYLQGQVTCDVEQLTEKKLLVGGHCDAKGKLFSAFRLLRYKDQCLLIQSKGSLASSLSQLQKYGVFAKVEISKSTDLGFLAVGGDGGVEFLQQQFNKVPDSFNPVIELDNACLIYIAGSVDRYLIIATNEQITQLQQCCELPMYDSSLWTAIEIQSGFVHLNPTAVGEYVPQMVNLQLVNGISFSKGCYMGQETVARMKYLGKNKRALFALQGRSDSRLDIVDDATLEIQVGDSWRRAGAIICSYQADSGELYLQAVLAKDCDQNSLLRLKQQPQVTLTLLPLPYSLAD